MREGWSSDDYLILFEEPEIVTATDWYQMSEFLPGYEIIGLHGWDDFLVRDSAGLVYSVPTVPLSLKYLEPFPPPSHDKVLGTDVRFTGKIKWYVKPVAFGGSPSEEKNMIWVDHVVHAELVRWWNDRYRDQTFYSSSKGQ